MMLEFLTTIAYQQYNGTIVPNDHCPFTLVRYVGTRASRSCIITLCLWNGHVTFRQVGTVSVDSAWSKLNTKVLQKHLKKKKKKTQCVWLLVQQNWQGKWTMGAYMDTLGQHYSLILNLTFCSRVNLCNTYDRDVA